MMISRARFGFIRFWIFCAAMIAFAGVSITEASDYGALQITVDPPATTVYVNGKKKGTTTPISLKLKEGEYTIRLDNPSYDIKEFDVFVGADTVQKKEVELDRLRFPRKAPLPESRIIKTTPMVNVPAGEFKMGSYQGNENEKPVHTVYLDAYQIGKYEVTAWQFAQFLNEKGNTDAKYIRTDSYCTVIRRGDKYAARPGYENHPVNSVSWFGAQAYADWKGMRLPTEAEWEKAARGTDRRQYPWGDNSPGKNHKLAVYDFGHDEKVSDMMPVDSLPAGKSPYGAHHMAGNVWEWCQDWYGTYPTGAVTDPGGPPTGSGRVLRGGGWYLSAGLCRSAFRFSYSPDIRDGDSGFRLALSPGR